MGVIPLFVEMIRLDNTVVANEVVWAIGNISSDRVAYRNQIIEEGGADNIVELIKKTK